MHNDQKKTKKRTEKKTRIIEEIGVDLLQKQVDECRAQLINLIDEAREKPYSESQVFHLVDKSLVDIIKANSDIKSLLGEQNQEQGVQDIRFESVLSAWFTLTGSNELSERYKAHEKQGLGDKALQWLSSLTQKPATSQPEAQSSQPKEYSPQTINDIKVYIGQLQDTQNTLQARFKFLKNCMAKIAPATLDKSLWLETQTKLRTQFNEFIYLIQFLDFEDFEKQGVRDQIDKLLVFIPAFFKELSQSTVSFNKSKLDDLEKTLLNHLGQDASYVDKGIRYFKPDYKHQPASQDTIISLLENILPIEEPELISLSETKQHTHAINHMDNLKSILAPLKNLKDVLILQRIDYSQFEQIAKRFEAIKGILTSHEEELNQLAELLKGEPSIEKKVIKINTMIQAMRNELQKFWKDYNLHRESAQSRQHIKERLENLTAAHFIFNKQLEKINTDYNQSGQYYNIPSASSSSIHYDDQPIKNPSVIERLRALRKHYINQRQAIIEHFETTIKQTKTLQVLVKSHKNELISLDCRLTTLIDSTIDSPLKEIRDSLASDYLIMSHHVEACRKKINDRFGPQHDIQKSKLQALGRPLGEAMPDFDSPFLSLQPLPAFFEQIEYTDIHPMIEDSPIIDNDESINQLFSIQNPFKLKFEASYKDARKHITEINDLLSAAQFCHPLRLLGINLDTPIMQKESTIKLETCQRFDNLARIMEDRLQNSKAFAESCKIIAKIRTEFVRIHGSGELSEDFDRIISSLNPEQLDEQLNLIDARLPLLLRLHNAFIEINQGYISEDLKIEEDGVEMPVMNDIEYVAALRDEVTRFIHSPEREHLSDEARDEFTQWFRCHVFKPIQALCIQISHLFGSNRDNLFFVTVGACRTERELVSTAIEMANNIAAVGAA